MKNSKLKALREQHFDVMISFVEASRTLMSAECDVATLKEECRKLKEQLDAMEAQIDMIENAEGKH